MILSAGVRASGTYFWAKKAGGATFAWSVLAGCAVDELRSALASLEEDAVSCGCSWGWANPTPVTAATNHPTTSLGQKQELAGTGLVLLNSSLPLELKTLRMKNTSHLLGQGVALLSSSFYACQQDCLLPSPVLSRANLTLFLGKAH